MQVTSKFDLYKQFANDPESSQIFFENKLRTKKSVSRIAANILVSYSNVRNRDQAIGELLGYEDRTFYCLINVSVTPCIRTNNITQLI